MTSVFTMVVPQWQGAAAGTGPYHGAQAIVRMLGTDRIDVQVPVHEQSVAKKEEGIWYGYEIAGHLKSALASLEASKPQRVLTIGGDCASDIASISYLNRLYGGDLTVLWLDAHADLNTPESSPSNKFHGMPLRLLLGEGAPGLLEMLPSTLEPGQVVFTGLRELDHAERQYIVANGIPNVPMCHECASMLGNVVAKTGRKHIYMHLDLDVIDPIDFDAVSCPTPGGFWFDDLLAEIAHLGKEFPIVGSAVTEYQPKDDENALKVQRVLEALGDAMR